MRRCARIPCYSLVVHRKTSKQFMSIYTLLILSSTINVSRKPISPTLRKRLSALITAAKTVTQFKIFILRYILSVLSNEYRYRSI